MGKTKIWTDIYSESVCEFLYILIASIARKYSSRMRTDCLLAVSPSSSCVQGRWVCPTPNPWCRPPGWRPPSLQKQTPCQVTFDACWEANAPSVNRQTWVKTLLSSLRGRWKSEAASDSVSGDASLEWQMFITDKPVEFCVLNTFYFVFNCFISCQNIAHVQTPFPFLLGLQISLQTRTNTARTRTNISTALSARWSNTLKLLYDSL